MPALRLVSVLSLAVPSLQYTLRHAPVGRPCSIRAASTAEAEAAKIDQPQELNAAQLTQEDGTLRRQEIASLTAAQGPEAAAMCLQEHLVANPGDADALIELGNVWRSCGWLVESELLGYTSPLVAAQLTDPASWD